MFNGTFDMSSIFVDTFMALWMKNSDTSRVMQMLLFLRLSENTTSEVCLSLCQDLHFSHQRMVNWQHVDHFVFGDWVYTARNEQFSVDMMSDTLSSITSHQRRKKKCSISSYGRKTTHSHGVSLCANNWQSMNARIAYGIRDRHWRMERIVSFHTHAVLRYIIQRRWRCLSFTNSKSAS